MAHLCRSFLSWFNKEEVDVSSLLNKIPIFLVESSMAQEYVAVPGCECLIRVPEDNYVAPVDEFEIDDWVCSKEQDPKKDDPRERIPCVFTIADLLGVYVFSPDNNLIPRRIFIWMDKIMKCAEKNTKSYEKQLDNAQALFDLVLYHEMAHALMDVELYGVNPSAKFTYANDYPYRFYEEAYANYIALFYLFYNDNAIAVNYQQKTFIERYVKSQGAGYSGGWTLYQEEESGNICISIDQWMGIKVVFNDEVVLLIKDMWEDSPFLDDIIKSAGHAGWINLKDHHNKWRIMNIVDLKMLPYEEVRVFHDGKASVKDSHGKWGKIDTEGNLVVPCTEDYPNKWAALFSKKKCETSEFSEE